MKMDQCGNADEKQKAEETRAGGGMFTREWSCDAEEKSSLAGSRLNSLAEPIAGKSQATLQHGHARGASSTASLVVKKLPRRPVFFAGRPVSDRLRVFRHGVTSALWLHPIYRSYPWNFSALGKAGQSKLACRPECGMPQFVAYATHATTKHIDLIESISGTPFARVLNL